MDRKDIHAKACEAVSERNVWEGELSQAYLRRKRKIRRTNKPYKGAADLVIPLIDTIIRKLTPFYTAQLTATELPAKFTFLGPKEGRGMERDMAELFAWHVHREGEFLASMRRVIDGFLTYKRAWLYLGWCPKEKRLIFRSKLPLYVICPSWVVDIQKSPWVVVVEHWDPQQLAEQDWCQVKDAQELGKLTGKTGDADAQREAWEQVKRNSEGVTYDEKRVVVWHCYSKKGGKVWLQSYCPQKPALDLRAITPVMIEKYPLASFSYDKSEEGVLAGESIVSLVEEQEKYATKLQNAKSDLLGWSTVPLFTKKTDVQGAGSNLTSLKHGDVLGGDVQAIQFPQPPVTLDQEMVSARLTAQEHVGMPDLALNQAKGGQRTATEAEMAGGLLSVGTDDRARGFREDLATCYRIAWDILVAFEGGDQKFYRADGEEVTVTPEALRRKYHIEPEGTPNTWDRAGTFQKLVELAKVVGQSADVDQEELVRMIVEALDPRWAKRILRDKTRDKSIALMGILDGLNALSLKLDQDGAPDDPVTMQAIMELAKEVLGTLAQIDPAKAQQAALAIQKSQQQAQAGAQAAQQMPQQPMPAGVN